MNRLVIPLLAACLLAFTLSGASAAAPATSQPTPPAKPPPPAAPAPAMATLEDFALTGDFTNGHAGFTLSAIARVGDSKGAEAELLAGAVALTDIQMPPRSGMRSETNHYTATFERAGRYPIKLRFDAAIRQQGAWNLVEFQLPPGALHSVRLRGLPTQTEFDFPGAERPVQSGADYLSHLPADGKVRLGWKEARPEAEGKLFYSAEMLAQISVSPGLLRMTALFDFKVMQGEMSQIELLLAGPGEVTRVQGDQVLAWRIDPIPGGTDRRLVVRFNQPQKDHFSLQTQLQAPLAAFPQTVEAAVLRPESATRFAGHFRIVNEGAVRLEVAQAAGLSQISPDQFPESEVTKALFRPGGSQRFAYRFSGPGFKLKLQADQILPELSVSEVLTYRLGENDLAIDTEIELDIREAPLRELSLRVPRGYAVAQLSAPGLSDSVLRDGDTPETSELRLVYGQPVTGRQVVNCRLERNQTRAGTSWQLPRVEVVRAKSLRGHLGVVADAGWRVTPERTEGVTEIATAFFPRKTTGLQWAFRLADQVWQVNLRVERLPQTVQADALHLFSIGEGIAYGSSLINYTISGAPVPALKIELSDEYFNVEFTGKDLRNWRKTPGGYLVQLQAPVAGPYTLLATYERPFKAQGETLEFSGARPLDAQSEQGYTLVVSDHQFEINNESASRGLLKLDPGEVPPEYRLFFDAPILAAYRYGTRPFDLKLALSPLAQGESLNQVVDRASLTNHISKEGQILTEARYYVKSRGNPNFRLTLPKGSSLWGVTVNNARVVPVMDGDANLIPLPARLDPNAVLTIDVKIAAKSPVASPVVVTAPVVSAPVMLADWRLEPDAGQRLVYVGGSLAPVSAPVDRSGFAGLSRLLAGDEGTQQRDRLAILLVLVVAAVLLWRWASAQAVVRFSARHWIGSAAGVAALAVAALVFVNLWNAGQACQVAAASSLSFVAPVQQAGGGLHLEIANLPREAGEGFWHQAGLPLGGTLVLWGLAWWTRTPGRRQALNLAGWTVLAWAGLHLINGLPWFLAVVGAFLATQACWPAARRLRGLPIRRPAATAAPPAAPSPAVSLLVAGVIAWGSSAPRAEGATATVVDQDLMVQEGVAVGQARIRWEAKKGETLPILTAPAVLTGLIGPTNLLHLAPSTANGRETYVLQAVKPGLIEVEVRYEVRIATRGKETGCVLPVPPGLVNRARITLTNLDVDVASAQAITVVRKAERGGTVASLVLSPADGTWVFWKPRSRDVRAEKAVFYADLTQLYVPGAGVIEGAHLLSIRPAQGELTELALDVPPGATVTDVAEVARPGQAGEAQSASIVSVWRFDPDSHKLRITLAPAQSRAFWLLIRSQLATGPLPFEQRVGLLGVDGAAGQIGLLGIATGNEVQVDKVSGTDLAPINLEDYPPDLLGALQAKVPGLTVRRAFRYASPAATAILKASGVEPDVRVETQDTLSLGEDRIVLAENAIVTISRAGVFRLSFQMPTGFDVESITGQSLSHWTETKVDGTRIITLHLTGKTEGKQQFAISLAGPGIRATAAWAAPRLSFREAAKQQGTLLVVPEQGFRLQMNASDGVTQLDPEKAGVRQKGVLAFRILQSPWNLTLGVEQVDSWIQVTSLQHALLTEAQIKVTANLQYQIDTAGLKALRVFVPTNADSVRFQGDQVADFQRVAGLVTNGLQAYEIKLHRRVIGSYFLQTTYQIPIPEQTGEVTIAGVQAGEVNLQRGFVTVQAGGRLQARILALPAALQPAEWQSIPRALQQDLSTSAATFAYRLVEPAFQLAVKLERHEAAQLLPARVGGVRLTSVISDEGMTLTKVRLEMQPGDKRLLAVTLPKDAQFWFAFVQQNGVWPWREKDHLLIPLDQPSQPGQSVPVELFYTSRAGAGGGSLRDLELLAPKFDLPLENLSWRVVISEKWGVKPLPSSLQFQGEEISGVPDRVDIQSYLRGENADQLERTREAESLLAAGNHALSEGDPQQARHAFQAAYGLSSRDAAFNEDARVQLHNVKLQEALVGLNVRQNGSAGPGASTVAKLRELRGRKEMAYTQQAAREMIDRNSADENAALLRLAEKLIQQQDAAVSTPAALRASVPEEGRILTFTRSVVVDSAADLRLHLEATPIQGVSKGHRGLVMAAIIAGFVLLALLARAAKPALRAA